MRGIWQWLKESLTRDDLFLRVLFFLFGAALGGGGLFGLAWLVAGGMQGESAWLRFLVWSLALFFAAWGALLFARSLVPSDSPLARLAEKLVPDSADEGALVLLVVFCLPAALLTILLRQFGVRGEAEAPQP